VNGFNVVYHQFIAMYDSGCQICGNWSRLKPALYVPAHRSTMSDNQSYSIPKMVNANQGNEQVQFFFSVFNLT